jgi:hypothetical protein
VSPRRGRDPEERRRAAAATLLLNRIALGLLNEASERPYADAPPPIALTDDLGTEYHESGGASYGGGPGASHAHQGFAPAISSAATVLHVTTNDGTVDIALAD